MDRRTFLKLLGTAGAGAAAGAHVLQNQASASEATQVHAIERTDAATPSFPTSFREGKGIQQVIWSVPTDQPLVALTFDDGPDPEFTPTILSLLDRFGVRATFNVMGYNALKHPDLLKRAVAAGHEIGNHTWSHRDLAYETPESTMRQLRAGKSAIEDVVEARIRFLRPPRGELTGTASRDALELGYDVLLWSVGRGPDGISTPAAVTKFVLGHITPGDILDLHDGIGQATFNPTGPSAQYLRARRQVEVKALPDILAGAKAKGLTFTTASALLAAASPGGTRV
jgi:peptidoglycan/xylan/chitin deacetylase (PgdA/CDA1 family)